MVNYQNENSSIEFLRRKDYKLIKNIGQGGTGKTVLLLDEMINEKFVCKKYTTFDERLQTTYFNNFIDEIKLLHLLYHENVVRIFNYYLFPENTTGYILMEYIEGGTIEEYVKNNPTEINKLFVQTINGFLHLEKNKILHRDIRPENILVSNDGITKIIDLGFAKKIEFDEDFEKSISLNWRYKIPEEFGEKIYDFCSEVYFVGKLFEELIATNNIQNFAHSRVLNEMIKSNRSSRTPSFFDVERKITSGNISTIRFSKEEKIIYRIFAQKIHDFILKIEINAKYVTNIDQILDNLDKVFLNNILEEKIIDLNHITSAFLKGGYYFNRRIEMNVDDFNSFLNLFNSLNHVKRKILLNNLWSRWDTVERFEKLNEDLPF